MITIKEKIAPIKAELLPRVASWIDQVRILFFSSLLLVAVSSCGDSNNKNELEQVADKATAKVDDIKQEYRENRDEAMVKDIAELNAEELLLIGQIQSRATVKDLKGTMSDMKAEHEKLAGQITEYAAGHQISLDNKLEAPEVNTDKAGAAWDKEAIDKLLDKHSKSVDEMQKAAEKATEPGLKTWAANTLPVLQQHAATLQSWQQKLKM